MRVSPFFLSLALSIAAWAPVRSRAVAAADADAIDDPKLARRLGSRVTLGASTAPTAAAVGGPVTPAGVATSGSAAAPASAPGVPAVDVVGGPVSAQPAAAAPSGAGETGRTPTIGLGYRRFSFVQIGATTGSGAGAAASEPFDSIALDFYPISRTLRFGLTTQYGWQSGRFDSRDGDYFIAQSVSLGVQHPGPTITPFAEAFAGAGYLRRFQFDRTIPTAYWQFGLDAGANLFVAEHGYVSLALGYLRPVNGFAKMQSFTSVYVDTWSLKLGFGL
ncbi:MAG TPA: hypothetical protein VFH68_14320 [Polyangia bacterium]|nr:hypothetical protein [Polyangia bacterium]